MVGTISGTTIDSNSGSANVGGGRRRGVGSQTHTRILEKAVQLASTEGLEALSLATLASAIDMSKSGLFGHFKSKEALQLAMVDEAERMFFAVVVTPARAAPPGIDTVRMLVDGYAGASVQGPFEGGCFFAASAHEFDGRPGLVRDRVAAFFVKWDEVVARALGEAIKLGEMKQNLDVSAFIFELRAIGLAANFTAQIGWGRDRARSCSLEAARALLERSAATRN